jgi:hypothetical protein
MQHASNTDRCPEKMDASNDNPEMEYKLHEAQALLICMRAETEKVAAIQQDMIRILLAVRHGRPIPPTPALNALYARAFW